MQAIARAHPHASAEEHRLLFAEVHYGREIAARLRDHLNSRRP
jgi:hypothetical protein